jgi:tetratricopeptide (TPR) repeat protein
MNFRRPSTALCGILYLLLVSLNIPANADLKKSVIKIPSPEATDVTPSVPAAREAEAKPVQQLEPEQKQKPSGEPKSSSRSNASRQEAAQTTTSSSSLEKGRRKLKLHVTATQEPTNATLIEQNLTSANELMKQGNYGAAAEIYHQTSNLDLKNVEAIVGYGTALVKQTKLGGALDQFDKALKLDPLNAQAHCGRSTALLTKAKYSSASAADIKLSLISEVEKESKKAIELDPTLTQAHFNLANAYREQSKIDEAVSELLQAVHLDPKHGEAYCELGEIALSQNHLTEAADYYKRAAAANSNNPTPHFGLGRTYMRDRKFSAAATELKTAANLYPNSWQVHQELAETYGELGESEPMIKELKDVIRIKPNFVQAYLRLADAREATGNLETAIEELKSAIVANPDSMDLKLELGWQTLRLGKTGDALKEYSNLLEQSPASVDAARGLVRCHHVGTLQELVGQTLPGKDLAKSDQLLEKAIASSPASLELRYARSELKALSGNSVDLSAVGSPKTSSEREAYAEALLAQNNYKGANEQFHTLLAKAENARQVFKLADVALLLKDLDAAEAGYTRANSIAGGAERSQRGLGLVSKSRESAKESLCEADNLNRRKDFAKAIPGYRMAIYHNPADAAPHIALARTLEKVRQPKASTLKEAALQYKAYLSASSSVPDKERLKYIKHIQELESRALKLEQLEKQADTPHRLSPTAYLR